MSVIKYPTDFPNRIPSSCFPQLDNVACSSNISVIEIISKNATNIVITNKLPIIQEIEVSKMLPLVLISSAFIANIPEPITMPIVNAIIDNSP